MSAHSCGYECPAPSQIDILPRYRRMLWVALIVNSAMFVPDAPIMDVVALLALLANVLVAWLLYEGDANMRSVWQCSCNDAIGNVAVFGAALGVFGTGVAWPDLQGGAALAHGLEYHDHAH